MNEPENAIKLKLRLFDLRHDVVVDFGKYENMMTENLNVQDMLKDVKQAFNSLLKQFEIDVTNLKKGNV